MDAVELQEVFRKHKLYLLQVRPAGAILKTKGGTSSGPEPLRRMLDFLKTKQLLSKRGQKLSTIDVHDMMCVIGDCVVQGGVRR